MPNPLRRFARKSTLWSGRQFDPQIVKVFLQMPDNIWEDLRKDIHEQNPSFPKIITTEPRTDRLAEAAREHPS